MRRSTFLLTLLALPLALWGCGKEETSSGPPVTPRPPGAAAPEAAKVTTEGLDALTKPDKAYKIALVVKTRNNPFFLPMIEAFEKEAKDLGVTAEVLAPDQEMDKEKQFALVQDLTAKKVDAICIAPADSKAIAPALKAAQEAGVLIINLDNRVDGETAKAQGLELGGYVGADNEEGGRLAGEEMKKALNNSGVAAVLEGIRGADNAEARKRGFEKGLAGELPVAASETAEWDTEKAYTRTQNLLAAHPDVGGLFCANDKMAVGAMKAIEEAGKTGNIIVIGYDNIPDVKPALESGALHATIEQRPDLMGKYGLRMAVGVLTGKIGRGGEILVPLEVVRKKGS